MNYDTKLGKWKYAGECSLVDYSSRNQAAPVDVPKETPVETPTVAPGKTFVDVPDDTSVNVRNTASLNGNVLTRLPEGTEVEVTSTLGDWSHVNYRYRKTGSGYIMNKFLKDGIVDVPNNTSVNVRSRPSTSSSLITTVPEGSKVEVVSVSGSWTKVNFSVLKSGTGYVMSRYLRKG